MKPLIDLLRSRFGSDFPVGVGSAKRNDPLVITDQGDYVSIEHGVSQFLLHAGGCEYELEEQRLHTIDGRAIDELVYAVKPEGAPDWIETRRFFFDISAGYNKI